MPKLQSKMKAQAYKNYLLLRDYVVRRGQAKLSLEFSNPVVSQPGRIETWNTHCR